MSRSTDIPFADDPLLAELRDARPEAPDDAVDPHAPANQAILEAILGVTGRQLTRRPLRRALPRVAAAAAVAALVTGLVVAWIGSPEPSAADVVRSAAAASERALDSGRATVTVHTEAAEGNTVDAGLVVPPQGTFRYRFAGEDVAVESTDGNDSGEVRIVDGEVYWNWRRGDGPASPWFHHIGRGPLRSEWTGDPRSLLATLEPGAAFEIVGDDTLDGVDVTHLRATTPDALDPAGFGFDRATPLPGSTLTGLDVWVDSDDVVRRIDLETTKTFEVRSSEEPAPPEQTQPFTEITTASVRFTDIGVPNTVEAPATSCDVSDEQLNDPPSPGADVC